MRFVSFNLLSQTYAKPNLRPKCPPEFLEYKYRISKIYELLESWVSNDTIIGLQEVSIRYKQELILYFQEKNYECIFENYSSSWSDFMGICIAYPKNLELFDIKILTPSSSAYFRLPEYRDSPKDSQTTYNRWSEYLWSFVSVKEDSMMTKICKTYNRQLLLTLKKDNFVFNVCCLHLPCRYEDPEFMSAYFSIILSSLSRCKNLVLLGDFNSGLSSDLYQMITTGKSQYPKIPLHGTILRDLFLTEEMYTNNSHSIFKGKENTFKGCIDYIFVSPDISDRLLNRKVFPQDDQLIPNENHPSDHCYLEVEMDF